MTEIHGKGPVGPSPIDPIRRADITKKEETKFQANRGETKVNNTQPVKTPSGSSPLPPASAIQSIVSDGRRRGLAKEEIVKLMIDDAVRKDFGKNPSPKMREFIENAFEEDVHLKRLIDSFFEETKPAGPAEQ